MLMSLKISSLTPIIELTGSQGVVSDRLIDCIVLTLSGFTITEKLNGNMAMFSYFFVSVTGGCLLLLHYGI